MCVICKFILMNGIDISNMIMAQRFVSIFAWCFYHRAENTPYLWFTTRLKKKRVIYNIKNLHTLIFVIFKYIMSRCFSMPNTNTECVCINLWAIYVCFFVSDDWVDRWFLICKFRLPLTALLEHPCPYTQHSFTFEKSVLFTHFSSKLIKMYVVGLHCYKH